MTRSRTAQKGEMGDLATIYEPMAMAMTGSGLDPPPRSSCLLYLSCRIRHVRYSTTILRDDAGFPLPSDTI